MRRMPSPRSCSSWRSSEPFSSRPGSAASTSPPRSRARARAIRRSGPLAGWPPAARRPSRSPPASYSSRSRPPSPSGIAANLGSRVAPARVWTEHRPVVLTPAITAVVAAVFALVVLRQYGGHRKTYQLMWGTGFAMFAVAAFAGYLAQSSGATETEYRLFYLFGAILNVAWLALGTMYLLAPRRWADISLAVVALLSAGAADPRFAAPVYLDPARLGHPAYPNGSLARILAAVGSGVGSIVLVGGALWSAWVFFRKRHNGRRAIANVIIAVGVFVVAAGGTAAFTGLGGVLEYTNLAGLAVIFAGFLLIG